uniref:Uncharacterized protein n=1 Tax=Romanomermis culicivorax TaxID=13658 RepID=A0A915KAA0_ROMCU
MKIGLRYAHDLRSSGFFIIPFISKWSIQRSHEHFRRVMRSVCFDSAMILFLWLLICGVFTASRDQTEDRNQGIPGLVLRPECRYFVTHGRRCVFDRNKTKCSRKLTLSPRIDSILCPEQKPEIPCEEQECIDSQKIPFAVEQLEPDFDCNYLAVERPSCVLVKGQCLRVKDYEPRLNDRQCFRFNLTGPCPAERCGDQIPKTPMVDESDQRWKLRVTEGAEY